MPGYLSDLASVPPYMYAVIVAFVGCGATLASGIQHRRGDVAGIGIVLLTVWGMTVLAQPWRAFVG